MKYCNIEVKVTCYLMSVAPAHMHWECMYGPWKNISLKLYIYNLNWICNGIEPWACSITVRKAWWRLVCMCENSIEEISLFLRKDGKKATKCVRSLTCCPFLGFFLASGRLLEVVLEVSLPEATIACWNKMKTFRRFWRVRSLKGNSGKVLRKPLQKRNLSGPL